MATVPPTARVVVIGAGIVGNSLVHHLARLGWRDIVQLDKGPLPNPGGSTGHASNFIFPVDHSREITDLTLDSVRQYKEMGVFTESGGFELARTEERMEELRRRMSSARAWGIEAELVGPDVREGEGPVHRDRPVHRGVLDPERGRGRLAAGRHDHARARPRDRRADRRTDGRGGRARHRGGPGRPPPDHPGPDHGRRHRGRDRGHRLRRVEPQDRRHGRDLDPADPGRPPDDQRRPLPAAGGEGGGDLLPDRPGHGHLLLRAPARRRHGGRLLRPPGDPARAGGHPVHRPGQALPDGDAVHLRRLRPAARAGLRADARAARSRGRRDALRHQRPAVAHLRRQPDPRREPGQGAVDRLGRLDQGGPRRRPRGRRVDDPRPARDRRQRERHRPVPHPPEAARAHPAAHHRGLHQDLRHHPPRRAVRVRPRAAAGADARVAEEARRVLLRDRRAGSGRTGTSPTPPCSRSTATR